MSWCSTVKFVRRKICEIVRHLPDQKQKFGCLSNCRYCADRAQNKPGPVPNNVLTVLQISSKSVHFRRSYSRTREHRFLPCIQYFPYFTRSSMLRFGRIIIDIRHPHKILSNASIIFSQDMKIVIYHSLVAAKSEA